MNRYLINQTKTQINTLTEFTERKVFYSTFLTCKISNVKFTGVTAYKNKMPTINYIN